MGERPWAAWGTAAALVLAVSVAGLRWHWLVPAEPAPVPAGVEVLVSEGGLGLKPATEADPTTLARTHPPLARAWAHRPPAGAEAALAHAEAGLSPVLTGRLEEALGVSPPLALTALVPALDAVVGAACPAGPPERCDPGQWQALQDRLPGALAEVLEDPNPAVAAELAVVLCAHPALARRVAAAAPPTDRAPQRTAGLLVYLDHCGGSEERLIQARLRPPPLRWAAELVAPRPAASPTSYAAVLLRLHRGASSSSSTAEAPSP